MRKGTLLIVAALALAAAGGGCARDDGGEGASREISFGTEASRAVIEDSNFPDGESFNVWGWYGDDATTGATPTQVFDAAIVTNNSGTWGCDVTRYWIPGKSYDFYALYPAGMKGVTCSSHGIIVVENFDASKTGKDAVDLMTASAKDETYQEGRGAVPLEFAHQLARVTIIVRVEQGVEASVSDAELRGIATQATFQCGLGEKPGVQWENPVPPDDPSYAGTDATLDADENQATIIDALVIPQSITEANLTLNYQRQNEQAITSELNLDQNSTRWEAGQHYTYTLVISSEYITFSGFTADGWAESHSGGDINIGD